MKSLKNILAIIFIIQFNSACNHEEHEHSEHHGETATVELNEGKAWKANQETIQIIDEMTSLASEALENESVDYDQLKTQFNADFKKIFDLCTMEGEAHEQLHNYLLPMRSMFAKLKNDNAEVSKESLEQIHEHLLLFNKYFQA